MEKLVACLFVILALGLQKGDGHSYSMGSCPVMEPMPEFNMNRMLGVWYVVQKTSTASFCITYNFTKLDEPGHYLLEQTSQHFILGLTPLKHQYHYTGYLKVPNQAVPGQMTVKFPLNVLGSAPFTVYITDYDNYAAIFTCQSLPIGHRRSASILSRTRTLDKLFIEKARTRLASYNIDPFELSIISQNNCPKPKVNETHGFNINIDPHTFSSENVAGVVRAAGEKIGDGIEYVAGGAKKVYHTFAESTDKVKETAGNTARDIGGKINNDAEFINVPSGNYRTGGRERSVNEENPSTDTWLP